jgi:lipid-A-disaccharide synthase-like uncharacterized protein
MDFRSIVITVGVIGQIIFFMRFMVQWLYTEKQRKSVVPVSFWVFSITGSFIVLSYSIIIKDPIFIAGQSLGFVIYIRNLYFIAIEKGFSKTRFRNSVLAFMFFYIIVTSAIAWFSPEIRQEKEPVKLFWLYALGLSGQGFFFLRFFVQWLYAEKLRKSVFPVAFWYFSLAGSFLLLAYSVLVHDIVFIIGQVLGILIYLRNLYFINREKTAETAGE